jgi:hypothetical protein
MYLHAPQFHVACLRKSNVTPRMGMKRDPLPDRSLGKGAGQGRGGWQCQPGEL